MKPSKCPTKEKNGKEKQKKRGGEKAKVKVEGAVKIFNPKSQNVAFCACLDFEGCNMTPETKAGLVLDM